MSRKTVIRGFVLLVLCAIALSACAPAVTSPTATPAEPPAETQAPTLPGEDSVPTSEATLPAAPEPVGTPDGGYDGWLEYENETFRFSLHYPADWTLAEDNNPDSTLRGRAIFLTPPQQEVRIRMAVAFRRADESVQITRTGLGGGDIVERGSVLFLGQPVVRDVLVAEGKDMSVLYDRAGEIARGNLVFTIGLDYAGSPLDPTTLTPEIERLADWIVASFEAEQ